MDVLRRSESDILDIKPKSRTFFGLPGSRARTREDLSSDSSPSSSTQCLSYSNDNEPCHHRAASPVEEVKQRWRNQQIAKQQELIIEQGSFWRRLLHRRGSALNMRRSQ